MQLEGFRRFQMKMETNNLKLNKLQDVLAIDPSQLAQLMPGAGGATPALQQVAVQVEGEPGEDSTQVIAQLLQADLPSPGLYLYTTSLI